MNVLNAVFFQTTWFGCVLGGIFGGAPGVAALVWHSWRTRSLAADVPTAVLWMLAGWALDTLWVQLGVLDYGLPVAPLWIAMLWFGVALTLNHSLSFLIERPLLGALLAAGAAPASYLGGERLGSIVVPDPWLLSVVAVSWGCIFYVTFARLNNKRKHESAH